jgi:hypothetical protein
MTNKIPMWAVILIVLAGLVSENWYMNRIITQQQQLIRAMATNPACLVPKQ